MDDSLIKIVSSKEELEDCKKIRQKVFQEEQGILQEIDFDANDDKADHVIVYIDSTPIGTGRARYLDEKKEQAKIGRVAVLKEFRNLGMGKLVMEYLHNHLAEKGTKEISLDSPEGAAGFYKSMGYVQEGDLFEMGGKPYVKMKKTVDKSSEGAMEMEALSNF